MEVLGRTPYYTIDYSDTLNIQYLSVHTGTKIEAMTDIINSLVDLNVFDREIWEQNNHIWCQSFVDSIEDVYKKRTDMVPYKYSFIEAQNVSGAGNEQSKLKERKKRKERSEKSALIEIDQQSWVKSESPVLNDSKSINNEETKVVYCPNGHGKKESPVSKIAYLFCSECDEPLLEKYMLPYHPSRGNA